MNRYVLLLRGINVGGKNPLAMTVLKGVIEKLGCKDVITYINSGNVVVSSDMDGPVLGRAVESAIEKNFVLDSKFVKVTGHTRR